MDYIDIKINDYVLINLQLEFDNFVVSHRNRVAEKLKAF